MDQIFFKFPTLLCLDLEEVLSQDPTDITSFSPSIPVLSVHMPSVETLCTMSNFRAAQFYDNSFFFRFNK
jgi:hypothetical protein